MGLAYWYAILPVHNLIFGGLLARIARHAGAAASERSSSHHEARATSPVVNRDGS